jgi:4-hydroxybenzoate polyprenyltransferase
LISFGKYLKRLAETLVFSNGWMAACAVAQAWLSFILVGRPVFIPLLVHLFCSTIFIYNFDRFIYPPDPHAPQTDRDRWMLANRNLVKLTSYISIAGAIVSAFFLKPIIILMLFFMAILAVGYSVPLVFFKNRMLAFKQFRGQKAFVIATVWAVACTALPLMRVEPMTVPGVILLLTLQRFFFVTALALQFDIRDMESDRQVPLHTFPVLYGIRKTQWFAIFLLALYFLFIYLAHLNYAIPYSTGMSLAGAAVIPLLIYSTPQRSDFYYTILIDGILIFQLIFVMLEKAVLYF